MNNLVSVITPSYNSSKFIAQTIESVLAQTYENWEMIIVDDASPDNSNEIIEEYCKKDTRIKLTKLKKNCGPAMARNRAIEEANGRYIAFLDSDDIWLPKKLEKQIQFMKANNLAVTYSAYHTIGENGSRINTRKAKSEIGYKDMLKSNQIGNLTGIYDCKKIGKYFMENVAYEDYVLWLKLIKDVQYSKGLLEPLAEYRISANSLSANKFKALKRQWNIYRKIEGLDMYKSIYYFIHYLLNALMKRW